MRGMNWDNVKCFILTARAGSLTTAANRLGVSPATLSRRLANLEHDLGRLLFARTPTGYILTREGEDLLLDCATIEQGFTDLSCKLEGTGHEPAGNVRIAVSENIANLILIPRLADFLAHHPLLQIECLTGIPSIALHQREADIAIRVSIPEQGAFKARSVGSLHHGLYLSRAIDPSGAGSDLGIVGWSDGHDGLPIARAAMAHSHWRNPAIKVSSLQGHVAAAEAGLGYAYLPCLVGDRSAGLVRVAGPAGFLRQDIYMVLHNDSIEMPRIRAVADFVVGCMNDAKHILQGSEPPPTL